MPQLSHQHSTKAQNTAYLFTEKHVKPITDLVDDTEACCSCEFGPVCCPRQPLQVISAHHHTNMSKNQIICWPICRLFAQNEQKANNIQQPLNVRHSSTGDTPAVKWHILQHTIPAGFSSREIQTRCVVIMWTPRQKWLLNKNAVRS